VSERSLLAIFVPFLILRGAIADFADPGLSALWAAAAAVAAAPVLWRSRSTIGETPGLWAMLPWALWALLSCTWSDDPGSSLAQASQLLATVLFALALPSVIRTHPRAVAWALVLAASLAAAAALRQVLFGFPAAQDALASGALVVNEWTQQVIQAQRAMGTFLAHDLLAAALAVALVLATGLVLAERRLRLAALACLLLIAAGFVAARSVGAGVALLVGAACLGAVLVRDATGRRRRVVLLAIATAVATIAVAAALPRLEGIQQRAAERLANQHTGFRGMQSAPVIGHGHNTFGVVAPALRERREPLTLYAHGLVGQSANDLGLVGLLLIGLAILGVTWQAGRTLWRPGGDPLRQAAAAGALAALAHGLIDYDLMFSENLVFLLASLGLCGLGATAQAPPSPRRGVGVMLAGLCVAAALLCGWRAISAARVASAEAAESCAARAAELEHAAAWSPPEAKLYRHLALTWLGCPELGSKRFEVAVHWCSRALAASPSNAKLEAELALTLALVGQAEEARRRADAAVQAWPQVGRVVAYRGLVRLQLGDVASARADLERAQNTDGWDPVVRRLEASLARSP